MSGEGKTDGKSSLAWLVGGILSVITGGGGYAFRDANDVPTAVAQDTANIRALLDRNLSVANAVELKLENIQKILDRIDGKSDGLRDRIGDMCGPVRRHR